MIKQEGELSLQKIGIRQASTLTGFCSEHDNTLFSPVEDKPFHATSEQCFLLAYRALCRELYLKESALAEHPAHIDAASRLPMDDARAIIQLLKTRGKYLEISAEHLRAYKREFDNDLLNADFGNVESVVLELANAPEVMCSSGIVPDVDIEGNQIQDPYDIGTLLTRLEALFFSSIGTDTGGAIVFSWRKRYSTAAEALANSIFKVAEEQIPSALIRYMFEYSENIYLNIPWWDSLSEPSQAELRQRMKSGLPGRYFPARNRSLAHGPRIANWTIIGKR